MKLQNLLQSIARMRGLLILSLMIISSLSSGCGANNRAPLAATQPTARRVWKLTPGDRLLYRLKYTSDSFTDLQALYGSVATAEQKQPRTSAPQVFRVTVEATAVMTAIQPNGASTIACYRFPDAQIDVESDMGLMINTDVIQAELEHAMFCEIDADGRIGSLLFDSGQSAATQKFSRALLGLMQFAQPENADSNQWQLDEDDPSGDYRAQYNAILAAKKEAATQEPNTFGTFRKTKLEYFPPPTDEDREQPEAPKTILPEAAFDVTFDFGKGRIESISGGETQTIIIANKVVGGARNEIQLALLSEEKSSSAELASAVEDYLKRSRTTTAIALSSAPSEQEQLTAISRTQLGDDSLATIKAALDATEQGASETDDSKLYSKLKALIFLHPETCLELGRMLKSSDPNGATMQLLVKAFAAVGHAAAQQALLDALRTRSDEAAENSLIMALGATKRPTQAAQDAIEEIAWGAPETAVTPMAQLQLGVMAHNLKKRAPKRAADIVEHAVEKLSAIAGSEDQLIALLGNSGVESALPTLARFLEHPSAGLRGHAALALRFIDGQQADEMLARVLTADTTESVRMQAADALEFRSMTQTTFDAQKQTLLSDKSETVRTRVMNNLWRNHEAYPEVVALMKGLAAKDSSKEVRRTAAGLLANS